MTSAPRTHATCTAADQDTATVDYTMTVTNLGPDTAVDAMLVDTLPEGLDDVEVSTTVGTCDVAALVITCDLGDMASGDEIVVEVSAMTTPFIDDTFTNVVEVTSSTPDPDLENNRDEVTTHIVKQELPNTSADVATSFGRATPTRVCPDSPRRGCTASEGG